MSAPRDEIIRALAGIVGDEAATRMVDRVRDELPEDVTTEQERAQILVKLSGHEGAVGVAVRLLLRKKRGSTTLQGIPATVPPPETPQRAESVPHNRERLITLMASSIGREKAAAVITSAMKDLRIPGDRFTREDALATLDAIATEPGLIGIVARFAKARALLELKD
jgi:hypothetical protein